MSNLEKALDNINKRYGKGAIGNLSDMPKSEQKGISTGSLGLDIALGVGGFARGGIVEVVGQQSVGKSTISANAVVSVQQEGGKAAYVDFEHAYDPDYSENLGVDNSQLLFTQPDHGNQGLDIMKEMINTGEVNLIVADSVAAMIPQEELNADPGDSKMGLHARLMSQACRMLSPLLKKNNCTIIFVNQYRKDIGAMYGSANKPTGGEALKYYALQRIELARTGSNKDKTGEVSSNRIKAKVIKNKVARPFLTAEFDMLFGTGIDKLSELVDFAVEFEIIKKSGSWFSYGEHTIGQGKENVKQTFEDNPELYDEIYNKVIENLNVNV